MPFLSQGIAQQRSELSSLSVPSTSPAAGLDVAPSAALREIAKSASNEELSFYKFQVDRRADLVGLGDSYIQGSMPSPHALLRAA